MTPSPIHAPTANAAGQQLVAPPLARRMAAFLYEGVLLFGVCVATGLVYSPLMQQRHALQYRFGLETALFIVMGIYFIWFWTHGGQTLAMKTWRIRLVDISGRPVPLVRALLRYVLVWTWFVPVALAYTTGLHPTHAAAAMTLGALLLGWIAFYALLSFAHPERQFWHDVLCGTRLIDVRQP